MKQFINGFGLIAVMFFLGLLASCSSRKDQLYEPGEANVRIITAMTAKNFECGNNHSLTVPVIFEAEKDDIEACAGRIVSTDCAEWVASGGENIPLECSQLFLAW